ncbi:hypothetical protein ACVWZ4_000512 [Bradyrhizobium sp. USDA 4472]
MRKKSGTFVATLHPMSGTKLNEQVTAMQRTAAGQTAGIRASEAELIDRARGRDEAALREIMQANNRRLYRLARQPRAAARRALPTSSPIRRSPISHTPPG